MALSECFYSFLVTMLVALAYKGMRMAYKSKCTDISFLGCVIKRNVGIENYDTNASDDSSSTDDEPVVISSV
jgi:hypothetical protein